MPISLGKDKEERNIISQNSGLSPEIALRTALGTHRSKPSSTDAPTVHAPKMSSWSQLFNGEASEAVL